MDIAFLITGIILGAISIFLFLSVRLKQNNKLSSDLKVKEDELKILSESNILLE